MKSSLDSPGADRMLGYHNRNGRLFSEPENPFNRRFSDGKVRRGGHPPPADRGGDPPLLQRSLHLPCPGGIPVV